MNTSLLDIQDILVLRREAAFGVQNIAGSEYYRWCDTYDVEFAVFRNSSSQSLARSVVKR